LLHVHMGELTVSGVGRSSPSGAGASRPEVWPPPSGARRPGSAGTGGPDAVVPRRLQPGQARDAVPRVTASDGPVLAIAKS
jgi:hypothetical protein